jgi:Tfp pilus assembly protein PilO
MSGVRSWQVDAAGTGLCVALTAAMYLIGLSPLVERYEQVQGSTRQLNEQNRKSSSLSSSVATARAQLAAVRKATASNPLRLLPARLVNNRLAEITELAAANGLIIEQIHPAAGRKSGRYEIVPIRIDGRGAYPTATTFMRRLRETFPDTGVASFKLSGNPSAPKTPATFELTLEWYALAEARKEPPVRAADAGAAPAVPN